MGNFYKQSRTWFDSLHGDCWASSFKSDKATLAGEFLNVWTTAFIIFQSHTNSCNTFQVSVNTSRRGFRSSFQSANKHQNLAGGEALTGILVKCEYSGIARVAEVKAKLKIIWTQVTGRLFGWGGENAMVELISHFFNIYIYIKLVAYKKNKTIWEVGPVESHIQRI